MTDNGYGEAIINPGKQASVRVAGKEYLRLGIKTHVITEADRLEEVCLHYARPLLRPGDILFITEKAAACTQGRAYPLGEIQARPLARLLCRFVTKTPHGIGLGIPETMEMALRECGTARILLAACISALGKLLGRKGWFYLAAGPGARAIDGPCDCTLPPYNRCVVLGPDKPDALASAVARAVGALVAITDINDLGGEILGLSPASFGAPAASLDRALLREILADNPLGQSREQTPLGIIRPC